LTRARRQFRAWRRAKRGRERIPEPLWVLAVKAAAEHGVNKTSRLLRLNHSSLQAQVLKQGGGVLAGDASTGFVELAMPTVAGGPEYIVEAEAGNGPKLRIHLKGASGTDLTSLVRTLWRPDR
jgi:hypothetical protein